MQVSKINSNQSFGAVKVQINKTFLSENALDAVNTAAMSIEKKYKNYKPDLIVNIGRIPTEFEYCENITADIGVLAKKKPQGLLEKFKDFISDNYAYSRAKNFNSLSIEDAIDNAINNLTKHL